MRIGVKRARRERYDADDVGSRAGAAQAQAPQLENGKTKAVYDYKTAVRERVFIPQPGIDADRNGVDDWVTADIIRPAESSCGQQDAGDHRSEPVLHDALSRQRGAVHD